MIALLVAAALAAQTAPAAGWTWILYEDAEPVVLAHEVPDTANLRTTMECDRGSGVARVTLYGGGALSGMARIVAGDASAVAEAEAGRTGSTRLAFRVDHPAFAAFADGGRVAVVVGAERREIEVPAGHLAKLRRFAELCSG